MLKINAPLTASIHMAAAQDHGELPPHLITEAPQPTASGTQIAQQVWNGTITDAPNYDQNFYSCFKYFDGRLPKFPNEGLYNSVIAEIRNGKFTPQDYCNEVAEIGGSAPTAHYGALQHLRNPGRYGQPLDFQADQATHAAQAEAQRLADYKKQMNEYCNPINNIRSGYGGMEVFDEEGYLGCQARFRESKINETQENLYYPPIESHN